MVLVVAPADHGHPIALWLASMVDANLLVLHAGRTRAPIAQRLRDLILEAGGNLAGFAFEGRGSTCRAGSTGGSSRAGVPRPPPASPSAGSSACRSPR